MIKEETATLGYKYVTLTLFHSKGFKSPVGVTETETETEAMETATLTHNYFSWSYHTVLSSRPHLPLLLLSWGVTQPEGCCVGHCPSRAPSHPLALSITDQISSDHKVRLTLPISHMGICICHFITPTRFCSIMGQLPLIFTGASCAENLWLTAQSRVNMQHYKWCIAMTQLYVYIYMEKT